jgi:XTP/dITP diphosphohydrolase
MIPPRLVLATGNVGKVRELTELVAEWGGVEVASLADFPGLACPEESGATYAENAVAKACAVVAATVLPALADDSGLEVDALDGAPGLHSARYAATDGERIETLLAALRDVPAGERGARFRCAVALAWPDGRVEVGQGEVRGAIAAGARGAGRGFGYDPIFVPDELDDRTFAEASAAEKHALSHRARAMRALGAILGRATLRPPGGPC